MNKGNSNKILIIRQGKIRIELVEMLNELSKQYVTSFVCDANHYFESLSVCGKLNNRIQVIPIQTANKKGIGYLLNCLSFMLRAAKIIKKDDYDCVLVSAITFAFVIHLTTNNKKLVLMGAHASVGRRNLRIVLWDVNCYINHQLYRRQIISNRSVEKKYRPRLSRVHLVNSCVGKRSYTDKSFNDIKLLYIGSISNRDIYKTIEGYRSFYREYKNSIDIQYTIIGTGQEVDVDIIKHMILKDDCDGSLRYLGRLSDVEVSKYFDSCNIGVGYIPVTDYYTNNYSFKVFEYLLSGIAVIATRLNTNKLVITPSNGVLIEEGADGFYQGLKAIHKSLHLFNSSAIVETANEYSIPYVIGKQYVPYINRVIEMNKG